MERMVLLEEQVVETTTSKINIFYNSEYQQITTAELINFLHVEFFSPVKQTWMSCIKRGFFNSFPGINK